MKFTIRKIISGGQTGADRAALDFALKKGVEAGGWVPKGRIAEDGIIASVYLNLEETNTENYRVRTELNVRDSDATLILSQRDLIGGTALTKELALKYQKPHLHIDFRLKSTENAIFETKQWLRMNDCRILNIAGHRASEDSEIYQITYEFLTKLFD